MFLKSPQFRQNSVFKQIKPGTLHRVFQKRFVLSLTAIGLLTAGLFLGTAYYFTYTNLELFKNLAFDTYPQFVRHLERESSWIGMILILSLSATGYCFYKISMRMTSHLIDPLIEMEKHMREVVHGKWQKNNFRISDEKDFRDLTLAYDYLLSTLQATTEHEIDLLSRMRLDPREKETVHIWAELLNEKRRRLGFDEINVSSLMTDVKPDQRRAS
ncbi:MAG: hypothetical protein ACK5V3_00640 [Bdellovibrionales bacterium]